MFGTIVGLLGIWFGLAALIGVLLDRRGRSEAWDRIATSRRLNRELQQELEERVLTLDVREEELDLRERRLDFREHRLFAWEQALERREKELGPPSAPPAA